MLFNSPINSSPVIYGNSLFFAGPDGYLYSLNTNKHEVPTGIFFYIALAILIVAVIIVTVVIKKIRKNNKKLKIIFLGKI